MATLHKFVDGTSTSLTIASTTGAIEYYHRVGQTDRYTFVSYNSTTSPYVDIYGYMDQSIEIVTTASTSQFYSTNSLTAGSTNTLTLITAPQPEVIDGKYHYIFPANTFTQRYIFGQGRRVGGSTYSQYYAGVSITSATAGVPYWEDVDIPEFMSSVALTPKTVEGYGGTTYQSTYIIYYPPTSTSKPFMTGYSNSQGKIRYFELPPGDGKFETNAVYYAFVADAIAYSQKVRELTATSISGSRRTWDAGPSDTTRYILITASVPSSAGNIATNTTTGTASVSNVWGTGTIHSRVSGSWT